MCKDMLIYTCSDTCTYLCIVIHTDMFGYICADMSRDESIDMAIDLARCAILNRSTVNRRRRREHNVLHAVPEIEHVRRHAHAHVHRHVHGHVYRHVYRHG